MTQSDRCLSCLTCAITAFVAVLCALGWPRPIRAPRKRGHPRREDLPRAGCSRPSQRRRRHSRRQDRRRRLARRARGFPKDAQASECRGVVIAGFQNSHVHFMESVWDDAARRSPRRSSSGGSRTCSRVTGSPRSSTQVGPGEHHRPAHPNREGRGARPAHSHSGAAAVSAGRHPFLYQRSAAATCSRRLHQPRTLQRRALTCARISPPARMAPSCSCITSPGEGVMRCMSPEVARAAVEETHAHGKLVLAHPTSVEGVRTAIAGGRRRARAHHAG